MAKGLWITPSMAFNSKTNVNARASIQRHPGELSAPTLLSGKGCFIFQHKYTPVHKAMSINMM